MKKTLLGTLIATSLFASIDLSSIDFSKLNDSYDDINLSAAFEITMGENITIAVPDSGILDKTKDDFTDNLIYDYTDSIDTSEMEVGHGDGVFNVISKKYSGDTVGVSPNSSYVFLDSSSGEKFALAKQNGADIVNVSFGSLGMNNNDDLIESFSSYRIKEATESNYDTARNGLGIVIVAGAGNANHEMNDFEFYDKYITVGAIKDYKKEEYSNYGNSIDIVAPLVNDSTGTSFTAPIVTGVAALILSANPNLTAKEVETVINTTATKYLKNTHTALMHFDNKTPIDANVTYDETTHKSNYFGHGVVNAGKAVKLAKTMLDQTLDIESALEYLGYDDDNKFTLNIKKGWNLISIPVYNEYNATKLLSDNNISGSIWEYKLTFSSDILATSYTQEWGTTQETDSLQKVDKLYSGKGYWLNSDIDTSIEFYGSQYRTQNRTIGYNNDVIMMNNDSIMANNPWKGGWILFGVGMDHNLTKESTPQEVEFTNPLTNSTTIGTAYETDLFDSKVFTQEDSTVKGYTLWTYDEGWKVFTTNQNSSVGSLINSGQLETFDVLKRGQGAWMAPVF